MPQPAAALSPSSVQQQRLRFYSVCCGFVWIAGLSTISHGSESPSDLRGLGRHSDQLRSFSSVLMAWLAVALCRLFSMGLVKEGVDMEEGTLEIGMGESRVTRSKLARSVP